MRQIEVEDTPPLVYYWLVKMQHVFLGPDTLSMHNVKKVQMNNKIVL